MLALAAIMAAAAGFAFAMLPRISPDSSLRPAVEESLPVSAIVTVDAAAGSGGGGAGVAGEPVGVAAHLDSEAGVSLGDGPSAAVVDKAAGNGALPSADAHSTTSC